METLRQSYRRKLTGVVVSDKMNKTIVVRVDRKFKHPLYGKFINKSKRYYAHNEDNNCKVGERVTIIEARPMSKLKRWELFSRGNEGASI